VKIGVHLFGWVMMKMIEHWQAVLAGILFCLPACVIIAWMAWRWSK
jgi:TRAP-type mannitol/chloroaromatic compound transport system permease small subunit